MSKLLKGSLPAVYWMGFLLADGHFTKSGSAIQVSVALQDQDHLTRFANFVGSNVRIGLNECRTSLKNKQLFPSLIAAYDIQHNKTYNPPNLKKLELDKQQFFALFVGFFDGDGCVNIKKNGDGYGRIRVHASWFENLNFFSDLIIDRFGKLSRQRPLIDARGYASWSLNLTTLRTIRGEAVRLSLPSMARKWDKIPARKILDQELVKYIQNSCDSPKAIASELNLPYGTVYGIKTGRSWRNLGNVP